jgi:hypothetical protein
MLIAGHQPLKKAVTATFPGKGCGLLRDSTQRGGSAWS